MLDSLCNDRKEKRISFVVRKWEFDRNCDGKISSFASSAPFSDAKERVSYL